MHHSNTETRQLSFVDRTSPCTTRGPGRQKPARRAGFTLVEMLVVVIIIAILAGMVMGLMRTASAWTAKAQTTERLSKIRAAIEEFNAAYGKYPPVPSVYGPQPFGYEYPCSNQVGNVDLNAAIVQDKPWPDAPIFTFGLMSFLVCRYTDHAQGANFPGFAVFNTSQWKNYNAGITDLARDTAAIQRWQTYILNLPSITKKARTPNVGAGQTYTNECLTITDGWGQELHYSSSPPYQSYKLWSDGPPGANTPVY